MKKIISLVLTLVLAVTMLSLAGCGSSGGGSEEGKEEAQKFIIATDTVFAPFEFTDDSLRLVCDVFDLAVRKKGSREGIIEAIEVFLRTIGVTTDFDIFIQNKDVDGNDIYYIEIGINCLWHDATLLREILRYILPMSDFEGLPSGSTISSVTCS